TERHRGPRPGDGRGPDAGPCRRGRPPHRRRRPRPGPVVEASWRARITSLDPMCGIVGIVSRPATRPVPSPAEVLGGLDAALAARGDVGAVEALLCDVYDLLHGVAGLLALVEHADLVPAIVARLDQLD